MEARITDLFGVEDKCKRTEEQNRWGLAMMDAVGEACKKEMENWPSEELEQAKENLKKSIDRAVEIGNTKHHVKGGTDFFGVEEIAPKPPIVDMVNHPPHYDLGDIQLIDIMIASQGVEAVQHFCACNVLKYVFRHQNKNGAEDMKKANWYCEKWLELEDKK